MVDLQSHAEELRLKAVESQRSGLGVETISQERLLRSNEGFSALTLQLENAQAELKVVEATMNSRRRNAMGDSP